MANENLSLVKHHLERFGILTVMDVVLYDTVTKAPVLELDTLKVSSISTEGSTKEVRGGLNSDLLLTYDHSRTVNIEIQDALLSMYSLQKFWGGVLNSDNILANEKITLTAAEMGTKTSILLSGTATGTDVDLTTKKYQLMDGTVTAYDASTGAPLSVTTTKTGNYISKITLSAAAPNGIKLYATNVYTKAVNTGSYNPAELVLKSNSFPAAVKLVGRTVFVEQQTGKQVLAEIEIPKLKITPSLTFTMDGEGDASTFDFSGSALVDTATKEIIKIKTLAYVEGILE